VAGSNPDWAKEAEQDPKKAPTLPYAKKGVAHLRAALRESGLA
jgi:hypothetical protein